jgi:hypothetical protein
MEPDCAPALLLANNPVMGSQSVMEISEIIGESSVQDPRSPDFLA